MLCTIRHHDQMSNVLNYSLLNIFDNWINYYSSATLVAEPLHKFISFSLSRVFDFFSAYAKNEYRKKTTTIAEKKHTHKWAGMERKN